MHQIRRSSFGFHVQMVLCLSLRLVEITLNILLADVRVYPSDVAFIRYLINDDLINHEVLTND